MWPLLAPMDARICWRWPTRITSFCALCGPCSKPRWLPEQWRLRSSLVKPLTQEEARIANALKFLERDISRAGVRRLPRCGDEDARSLRRTLEMILTSSLWPTNLRIRNFFKHRFNGRPLPRTVGDYLAHKRSFALDGLRQEVEIHIGRLGQAGEHIELAQRFVERRLPVDFNGYTFLSPAPEERIIAGTLQRMYRHLYFRVCDILNTARMIESGCVDYRQLRTASDLGGIWDGVATYLEDRFRISTRIPRHAAWIYRKKCSPAHVLDPTRCSCAASSYVSRFCRKVSHCMPDSLHTLREPETLPQPRD